MKDNKKIKIKTIDDIKKEESIETMNDLLSCFDEIIEKMVEEETFLIGHNLFENMSYGSRRIQELCNLTFGKY